MPPKFLELSEEYDNIDFDTNKEASSFLANLKQRMLDIVILIAKKEPAAVFTWIKAKIDKIIASAGKCLLIV
jgi:hypothetical protein